MERLRSFSKETEFLRLMEGYSITIHGVEDRVDWKLDMGDECICVGRRAVPVCMEADAGPVRGGSKELDRAFIICSLCRAEYFAFCDDEHLVLYVRRADGLYVAGDLETLRGIVTERAGSWRDVLWDLEEDLRTTERPSLESLVLFSRRARIVEDLFPSDAEATRRDVVEESTRFSEWRDDPSLVEAVIGSLVWLARHLEHRTEKQEADAMRAASVELARSTGLPSPDIPF